MRPSSSGGSMMGVQVIVVICHHVARCAGRTHDQRSSDGQRQRAGRVPASRKHSKLLPHDLVESCFELQRRRPTSRRDSDVRRTVTTLGTTFCHRRSQGCIFRTRTPNKFVGLPVLDTGTDVKHTMHQKCSRMCHFQMKENSNFC